MRATCILGAVLASAAVASAQLTDEGGTFACEEEGAAYCAGDSLGTDIIIRCNGNIGQPGRCSNNLAGQPPLGASPALCWQTSPTSGDAACVKNCVVYGDSGNADGTFTLPADVCTPTYTATESSSPSDSTASEAPSSEPSLSATVTTETETDTETRTDETGTTTETETDVDTETILPTFTASETGAENGTETEAPTETETETGAITPTISISISNNTALVPSSTPPFGNSTLTTQNGSTGLIPTGTGAETTGTTEPTESPIATAAAARGQAAVGALVVLGGFVAFLF